jgi:hypothetical protein
VLGCELFVAELVDGVGAGSLVRLSSQLTLVKVAMLRWSFGRFAMVTALSCGGKGPFAVSQECCEVAQLLIVEDIVGVFLTRTFTI